MILEVSSHGRPLVLEIEERVEKYGRAELSWLEGELLAGIPELDGEGRFTVEEESLLAAFVLTIGGMVKSVGCYQVNESKDAT